MVECLLIFEMMVNIFIKGIILHPFRFKKKKEKGIILSQDAKVV